MLHPVYPENTLGAFSIYIRYKTIYTQSKKITSAAN